jgi:transposase
MGDAKTFRSGREFAAWIGLGFCRDNGGQTSQIDIVRIIYITKE